jgi:hydrogenase maturation protein HypF
LKKISTWHIHIKGQVQGVGFRPFVYQFAQEFQLKGWVNNNSDGVHIEFNADEVTAQMFYDEIVLNAPELAHVTSHCMKEVDAVLHENFKIIWSRREGNPVVLLSPDFAMCKNCRQDIFDRANRRYKYAFTTCTQCGPRYSIIRQLPYDRENTTMAHFKMCNKCNEEYNDPANRRHFSQTNSCPDCGVLMKLYDNNQNVIEEDQIQIIEKLSSLWSDGKVVAIKGIGGYLLTCDASKATAIKELRRRKNRPTKPFALMFPDLISLKREVHLNQIAISELKSIPAPIVLLPLREDIQSGLALNEIAPLLSRIGAMLPYTPLYELLLQKFKKPIVATSGNISNAPIVFENEVALNELNAIADYNLIHNREIVAPQDDSLVSYSRYSQQRIMLRQARGFSPLYLNKNLLVPGEPILSMGAMLKSSFSLLHKQNIHVSQYLGNTDDYDTQKNFDKTVHHFLALFQTKPEVVLMDKHPGYFTTQFGEQKAKKWGSQLIKVQHHEAHFASVLGEHNLLDEQEPILGVMWDGTGLGNDKQIWGGEFFVYHQHTLSRVAHFDYFNHFLGDKMATDPRISAFTLCHDIEEASIILQPKFSSAEWANYKLLIKKNNLKTSSVGRLFDAVASLLGLVDKASYEGEAAMLLEEQAHTYFKSGLTIPNEWLEEDLWKSGLSTQSFIKEIVRMINEGNDKSEIAAWFHVQLVWAIKKVASQDLLGLPFHKICFSGGVFQNGLLLDLLIKILGENHQLYFNKNLSPNDENISFGQLMWFTIMKQGSSTK